MIKIIGCTGIGLFLVYFFRENPTLVSGDFHARVEGKPLPMDLFYALSTNYKEELDEGKEVSHANESERQIF
ncbi:hypothetical protein [Geobacillus stearothermophilus]|uniref:hypothetical protein n=1 Tax=Geobacillus stearothermophilus TaxID=1422 RepID=UPI003D1E2CC7